MEPFKTFTGLVMPLDRSNVDTDAIIPKQYLKSVRRTGFGPNLFDDWRYLDPGDLEKDNSTRRLNRDFVLNQERFQGVEILLARENFGCGSSREHAVWSLMDYGFRAMLAPSYSDIFYSNSFKNGFLPIQLDASVIDHLFNRAADIPGFSLTIDLEKQTVSIPEGGSYPFEIDNGLKYKLINGLDEIGITLAHVDAIKAYEDRRCKSVPWLFQDKAT